MPVKLLAVVAEAVLIVSGLPIPSYGISGSRRIAVDRAPFQAEGVVVVLLQDFAQVFLDQAVRILVVENYPDITQMISEDKLVQEGIGFYLQHSAFFVHG